MLIKTQSPCIDAIITVYNAINAFIFNKDIANKLLCSVLHF